MTPANPSNPRPRLRAERSTWGSQSKDLLAIDLATGSCAGSTAPRIPSANPPGGRRRHHLYRRSQRCAARGECGRWKRLWTFKTEAEIRSSPVISGDRLLIGSYDGNLYCLSRPQRQADLEIHHQQLRAWDAGGSGGVAYVSGCDEVLHGIRLADGEEVVQFPPAVRPLRLRRWSASGPGSAISTMKWWAPTCARTHTVAVPAEVRAVPVLLLGGGGRRPHRGGRADKAIHCLNARTGKVIWTFATKARVDSSAAIAGAACTSVPTTAISTCSTWLPG